MCILPPFCKTYYLVFATYWWARIGDQLAGMFNLKAKVICVNSSLCLSLPSHIKNVQDAI